MYNNFGNVGTRNLCCFYLKKTKLIFVGTQFVCQTSTAAVVVVVYIVVVDLLGLLYSLAPSTFDSVAFVIVSLVASKILINTFLAHASPIY